MSQLEPGLDLIVSIYARNDIEEIFIYTLTVFGEVQALSYDDQLNDGFQIIRSAPHRSTARPGNCATCRSKKVGKHIVHFRIGENEVTILRVLHGHQRTGSRVRRALN